MQLFTEYKFDINYFTIMKKDSLMHLFKCALDAVEPYKSVCSSLKLKNGILSAGNSKNNIFKKPINEFENIFLVGCGKAVSPMADAVYSVCGQFIRDGLLVTKYGHSSGKSLSNISIIEAGHPVPDQNGVAGAQKTKEMLRRATKNDLVIALISGGGSVLWPLPAEGISLHELKVINQLLLESGASIHEINTIRKHISQLQGGNAAAIAYPATTIVLMISDVIGDDPGTIGSGPFFQDPTTFADALLIVKKYQLLNRIPKAVVGLLSDGASGKLPETRKKNDDCFNNAHSYIICTNAIALKTIHKVASKLGYESVLVEKPLQGEVKEAARNYYNLINDIRTKRKNNKPLCIISGGETTVTLGNNYGHGGRNQEFALAAAFYIEGQNDISILSCGTDGTDGPTDVAGAIVDGSFIAKCQGLNLDAKKYLSHHDSYSLFEITGNHVKTGPTLTNVMDVQITIFE